MVGDRVRRRIVGRGSGDGFSVVEVLLGTAIDAGERVLPVSLRVDDAVVLFCVRDTGDNEGIVDCICVAVDAALGNNVGVVVALVLLVGGKLGKTVLVVVVGLKLGGALWCGRSEGCCFSTGVVGILILVGAVVVTAAVGEPVRMFMLIILPPRLLVFGNG